MQDTEYSAMWLYSIVVGLTMGRMSWQSWCLLSLKLSGTFSCRVLKFLLDVRVESFFPSFHLPKIHYFFRSSRHRQVLVFHPTVQHHEVNTWAETLVLSWGSRSAWAGAVRAQCGVTSKTAAEGDPVATHSPEPADTSRSCGFSLTQCTWPQICCSPLCITCRFHAISLPAEHTRILPKIPHPVGRCTFCVCVPAASEVCAAAKNVRQSVPGCGNCERVPGGTAVRAGPGKAVPPRVHGRAWACYCKRGIRASAPLGLLA